MRHLEKHHEVKLDRQIADVRPWGQKAQEWLSSPSNFIFCAGMLGLTGVVVPVTLPFTMTAFGAAYLAARSMKNVLPYRYPIFVDKKRIPKSGKGGKGILLMGTVRSESPYEKFKQCWLSDDDLRKHWLILGATGSGKSETLKGIFYNSLCWGSGFFCADGKADNKLPTDGYTMARAFGREDDILALNFLLGGKSPQQVARSRRIRSNSLNPFSSGDADTLIQMGANLLPKAEGDGKSWQEKALAVWRAVVTALCYKRDTSNFTLSVGALIDYLALHKIEELYVEGFKEAETRGDPQDTMSWSYGYIGIKNYLDSGLPGFSVENLEKKHSLSDNEEEKKPPTGRMPPQRQQKNNFEQDPSAAEQHGYRVGQLMPVLNLLDKTYGYIFKAAFSEIDMIDVALRNRILFLLIPSLEKSAQEAENLGKLAIACLRVMMARNLGSDLEGSHEKLMDQKATNAPYPYIAALDELGYYFADGIAVMFAQARSLGISMIALAQDLEKLTEGSRAAEAGAMVGNTVNKFFMKIDDPNKTWELAEKTLGKVSVALYNTFRGKQGSAGFKREREVRVEERSFATFKEMNQLGGGEGVLNALGHSERINSYYMGHWLEKLGNENYHLNRFMQVYEPSDEDMQRWALPVEKKGDKTINERVVRLTQYLRQETPHDAATQAQGQFPLTSLAQVNAKLNESHAGIAPIERGAVLYLALRQLVLTGQLQAGGKTEQSAGSDVIPSLTQSLSTDEFTGLAESFDEHGLPDPLALLRKPVEDILAPTITEEQEQAVMANRPAATSSMFATTSVSDDMGTSYTDDGVVVEEDIVFPEAPQWESTPNPQNDFAVGDDDAEPNRVENILAQSNEIHQSRADDNISWVSQALQQANLLREQPRSVDNTAIGLNDESLSKLAELEAELGSDKPVASAHSMQKVVAAQITPETIGSGRLRDDEIEGFFEDLLD